ncbi:MAG: hypothetical protein QI199_00230 [Candidatus Korarchaeota archaeon]|nr:hypothetical protein [Candidatus Korarchaeota archaeon]
MDLYRALREIVLGGSAIALIASSFYFFLLSISMVSGNPPNVTASLLSALIGFSVLSAGVTILRSWAVARAAEKGLETR